MGRTESGDGRLRLAGSAPGEAPATGPVTETDGVVFAGTYVAGEDNMFALEASTGKHYGSFKRRER